MYMYNTVLRAATKHMHILRLLNYQKRLTSASLVGVVADGFGLSGPGDGVLVWVVIATGGLVSAWEGYPGREERFSGCGM